MERSYVDVGKKSKGADVIDIYKLFILNFSIWKMLNHAKDFFFIYFIFYFIQIWFLFERLSHMQFKNT